MKFTFAHRLSIILLLFSLAGAQEKLVEVIDAYTNIYIAPTPNSKLLGVAHQGKKCTVISDINDWYRVKYEGVTGWLRKSSVQIYVQSAPPPEQKTQQAQKVSPTPDTPVFEADIAQATPENTVKTDAVPYGTDDTALPKPVQPTTSNVSRREQKKTEQKPVSPQKSESRIKNWFTQQNFFQTSPVDQQVEEDVRYFQVTYSMAKILLYLSPDSPLLGMAKKGENLVLIGEGDSWCKVAYKDTTGWIERKYGNIIDTPESSLTLNLKGIGILLAIAALVFLSIFLIVTIMRKKRVTAPDTDKSLTFKKNVFVIAKSQKSVQSSLTDTTTTLEKCFLEAGFKLTVIKDLPSLRNCLTQLIPDVVMVDTQFDRSVLPTIERLFSQIPGSDKILFIVYNTIDPSAMQPSRVLPSMVYLGSSFTDREIFKLVTPHLLAVNSQNIQKSIQSSALEGNIADGNLIEVLQYIEIGSKTGCILIEAEKPVALIYFNNGRIIFAATSNGIMGRDAIYSVLNLKEGNFRFLVDRKPKSSNVNLSTLEVLMEWTKAVDEATGH
ncbi:MAG: DUF4388 domain-containing protein [Fibrobacter sp.]|nr:DUF4388 domain-containing protein [Fibrobacter sp.]